MVYQTALAGTLLKSLKDHGRLGTIDRIKNLQSQQPAYRHVE